VATDKAAQREREARWSYLQGAYKDPHGARAALDELVKREGWTSAAARLSREPEQLGELRGKMGWLASATAKQERAGAERAVGALPGSLERIGDAEGRVERSYRASVEGQRAADATGIPRLSPVAEAALSAVAAAGDKQVRGAAWRTVQADTPVAAELERFGAVVEQRFGAEGVRAMLRAEGLERAWSSARPRGSGKGSTGECGCRRRFPDTATVVEADVNSRDLARTPYGVVESDVYSTPCPSS